jgi:outer membrane protein OmpA-like peptidoglycan-associated protein
MRVLTFSILLTLLLMTALKAVCQEAPLSIIRAREAYANHEYLKAARLYEKVARYHVIRFRKVPADVPGKLAVCYRELNDYADAARWYKTVTDQSPRNTEDWIFYGDALKSMGLYTEAKAAYRHVPDSLSNRTRNRVAGCDSAVTWVKSPTFYNVSNLAAVNTGSSDWGAVWYSNSIIFTSDSLRSNALDRSSRIQAKKHKKIRKPYQKIYVMDGSALTDGSTPTGSAAHPDSNARTIKGFAPDMNDNKYHDGAVAFTPSGDTAYFTVTNQGVLDSPGDKIKYREGRKTVTLGIRRLELWWAVKDDSSGGWGSEHAFAYNNSSQYSVGQAALSPDGSVLYFASDMPGGYGKMDIWYVERTSNGSWSAPVNCGPLVNTDEEEAFPSIGIDGALYFASKGHIGMGGFDVFKATGQKNDFKEVSNLQYPINSPGDDFYFTPKDSLSGFLSSDRQGGKGGDDIYVFSRPAPFILALPDTPVPTDTTLTLVTSVPDITPDIAVTTISFIPTIPSIPKSPSVRKGHINHPLVPDPPDETDPPGMAADAPPATPRVLVLKTIVLDWLSGEPLEGARVTVTHEYPKVTGEHQEVAGEHQEVTHEHPEATGEHQEVASGRLETPSQALTGIDGLYYKQLDSSGRFTDSAFKQGYTQDGHTINTTGLKGSDTLSLTLRLQKQPEAGDLFVFRHLYFDFNKSAIRPDAALELNRLVDYMRKFPSVIIDLSAHTDSRGNDDYNQALSERRAASARSYLLRHGIALHRTIIHGYGEAMPVNGCKNGVPCTEAEYQANRRVEIKILQP